MTALQTDPRLRYKRYDKSDAPAAAGFCRAFVSLPSITLSWQDNATNEHGFGVERRQVLPIGASGADGKHHCRHG